MLGVDLAPGFKVEHGRAVAQDNLTRRALGAGCKITFRSRGHRRQCVLGGPREAVKFGDELKRNQFEDGFEQNRLGRGSGLSC